MASLALLFKNCPCGPPRASDGPLAACKTSNHMCKTICRAKMSDLVLVRRPTRARRPAWLLHEECLTWLRNSMHATTVDARASGHRGRDVAPVDLGAQGQPAATRMVLHSSRDPLSSMAPSDGQFGTTFQKWSSWTTPASDGPSATRKADVCKTIGMARIHDVVHKTNM